MPDVLGAGFEQLTLPLGEDDEGELCATLVRHRPMPRLLAALGQRSLRDVDVLYVHGWNDYFFQRELAQFWTARGARFFALDLRKYGRSIRPGQTRGFITDLADYGLEIEAALTEIGSAGRRVFLLGHSTGGLVLSLWAARHPGRIDALILNSPWLETQGSLVARALMAPIVKVGSLVNVKATLPQVDAGFYARSIDKDRDGEWRYNHDWRLDQGAPPKTGWAAAIINGHAQVAAGLNIDVPILTLLSKRSHISPVWSDEMLRSDVVLVVDDIAKRATGLGRTSTIVRLDGALHDVFLSAPAVRAEAYRQLDVWLSGYGRRSV